MNASLYDDGTNFKSRRTYYAMDYISLVAKYPQPYLSHPRVSLVIPAKNEARNLEYVLPRIPSWVYEVLLVDGNSTDDTVEVARRLCPTIRIIGQQGRGKGAALRSGFAAATGDIIVMIDADGSMDPAEITSFVGQLLAGADFVKGSRFIQGGGTADMEFYRRMGNWCFTVIANMLYGGKYSDLCYGYNAFWKHVIHQLALDGDGFEIETMMNVRALRHGFKVAEVPSFEARRIHGVSNLQTLPDGWRVLKTLIKERLCPRARQQANVEPTSIQPDQHCDKQGCLQCIARSTIELIPQPTAHFSTVELDNLR